MGILSSINPFKQNIDLRKQGGNPLPVNRIFNYAWYSGKYTLTGEYNPNEATNNAIVGACISWLYRALSQLPLRIYLGDTELDSHPALELLRIPNNRHTYRNFLYDTIRNLILDGQQINIKLSGNSVQVLPWESIIEILPNTTGEQIKYRIQTLNGTAHLDYNSVAHTLYQPHPNHSYAGVSPLRNVYAELLLDRFAREATAGRLQAPIPGIILKPKDTDGAILPQSDVDDLSKQLDDLRGTGSGSTWLGEARIDMEVLKDTIHKFDYSLIYGLCEARICAQLGIPPSVAQMGVGLAQTRVGATMEKEIQEAYNNGAKAMAAVIEDGWSNVLLPLFGYTGYKLKFDFGALDFLSEVEKFTKVQRLMLMKDHEGVDQEKIIDELNRMV